MLGSLTVQVASFHGPTIRACGYFPFTQSFNQSFILRLPELLDAALIVAAEA
jgi:hypothetical protein